MSVGLCKPRSIECVYPCILPASYKLHTGSRGRSMNSAKGDRIVTVECESIIQNPIWVQGKMVRSHGMKPSEAES